MPAPVAIVECREYDPTEIGRAVSRLFDLADGPSGAALQGRRVLLKPNLLTDRLPEQAVTTHPEVARQMIRRLKAEGAQVTVGDSPASAANLRQVWRATGMEDLCASENVPLVSFEQAGSQTFEIDGFSFSLARPVVDADLVINLPKVKSHSLTILTAAVKNLYGAIPGYNKTTLHRIYPKPATFGRLIRALWRAMPPSWTLADAIVGMEGQGPANGRPVRLGFLAASSDPFALDRALCQILRIPPRKAPPYLADDLLAHPDPPVMLGDPVTAPAFEIPSGAHLLARLPDWLLRRASRVIWVRPAIAATACTGCGQCVAACPVHALALTGAAPPPRLDPIRCISCCCCHEVCPANAVRMTQSALLRFLKVFKGLE